MDGKRKDSDIIREFYDAAVEKEWVRLEGNPYEFEIHRRYFDRYIKPGDRVLDIGGGPGRYSLYLAERGCDVTLVDLSPANVAFALAKADERGLKLTGIAGNALDIESLADGGFDHVLLMGPLYHILEADGRETAVRAALSRLRDGGMLYAAFISLYGGMIWWLREGLAMDGFTLYTAGLSEPERIEQLKSELELIVRYDSDGFGGDAFTRAYFMRQCDVLPFFGCFPLEKLHLIGSEGVLAPFRSNFLAATDEVKEILYDIAERMCEREELLSYSEHLMYIGRKQSVVISDEQRRDIERVNALPWTFDGFTELPALTDGSIELRCVAMQSGNDSQNVETKLVPQYCFEITKDGEKVGDINLRIGYCERLYYGGQIGYNVEKAHRGNGYAAAACRLLIPVAKAHGMGKLFITNNVTNYASRRVCEKLGAKFVGVATLPEWMDLYRDGQRESNVFEWDI